MEMTINLHGSDDQFAPSFDMANNVSVYQI